MSKKQSYMYYLGETYPGVYFTRREVECLLYLLEGHTIVGTAELLGLSPRTVEFYVKNMRMKTGAQTKLFLLEKMRKIEFKKHFDHQCIKHSASLSAPEFEVV